METQVAILGPSDVARESEAVKNAISDMSKRTSQYGVTFTPVDWKAAFPAYRNRDPQHNIDPLLSLSQIYIAVFSGKTGREFADGITYTVHEINSAILRYKRHKFSKFAPEILLYFRNDRREIGASTKHELENAIDVLNLRMSFENQALINIFEDENDLVRQVSEHSGNTA